MLKFSIDFYINTRTRSLDRKITNKVYLVRSFAQLAVQIVDDLKHDSTFGRRPSHATISIVVASVTTRDGSNAMPMMMYSMGQMTGKVQTIILHNAPGIVDPVKTP